MQSEHLTDKVTGDLAQFLPVWIPPCLDGSACRYHSPCWRVIRPLRPYVPADVFDSVRSLSASSPDYEQQCHLLSSRESCKTRSEEPVCDGRGRQPPPSHQLVRLHSDRPPLAVVFTEALHVRCMHCYMRGTWNARLPRRSSSRASIRLLPRPLKRRD